MTIKELEQAVGMTRANIRFYEQEGLIAPARSANGYRDYSDRDVEALERIKLLRRLHLDLDTIRALQAAQTELPAALERQLDTLESDRAALERAREICRQLRDSGVDYAALDARHWLEELDKSDSDLLDKVFLATDTPATRHAWRRFWARLVDIQLYGILLSLLNLCLLHLPPKLLRQPFYFVATGVLTVSLALLFEPFLLHFFGATPGKAISGISVRDANGEKLSLAAAWKRTLGVVGQGLAFGIPIATIVTRYRCYRLCEEGGRCVWEWGEDGPEQMRVSTSIFPALACAAALIATGVCDALLDDQAQLPPNRGELDLAAFAENHNYCSTYLSIKIDELDENGQFHKSAAKPTITFDASGLEEQHWTQLPGGRFQYTATATKTGGRFRSDAFLDREASGLLAFAGAQDYISGGDFRPEDWVEAIPEDLWEYDVTYRGIRMTQSVEFSEDVDLTSNTVKLDGEPVTLTVTFTLERVI